MKIVLINPRTVRASTFPTGEFFSCTAPNMGLAYLAAVLQKEGYAVDIIDAQALGLGEAGLRESLRRIKPDIIGSTATTTTIYDGLNAIKIGRELYPEAFTILGGVHASVLPVETLTECPQLDAVCIGEGEETIVALARALERKECLAKVRGIAYKRDKQIIRTQPRALISDLDSLPLPARNLLPMEKYASGGKPHRTASIVSSRGCPFHCAFCATPYIAGWQYRARSAQNIVAEILHIVEEYDMHSFEFVEDLFTMDNKRVTDICDGIIDIGLNVTWSCSARADTVTPELISKMAEGGCRCIFYGIESGCQRVLDLMKKGERLQQIADAVRWTEDAGMQTWGFFILGFPGETRQELEMTIQFAGETGLDFAEFFIISAFPGSPLYTVAKKENMLIACNWADIAYGVPNVRNPEIPPEELQDYLIKAYKVFYTSPGVVSRLTAEGQSDLLDEILHQVS